MKTIGRIESIDIPEWDLFDIAAKVDTGAYTSSLHAHHILPTTRKDKNYVTFYLLDPSHPAYNNRKLTVPVHKRKSVKSSNGIIQQRFIVSTEIKIFNQFIPVQLSLTDRSEMKYPILLGRRMLKNRFLVDVSKTNCSRNTNKK